MLARLSAGWARTLCCPLILVAAQLALISEPSRGRLVSKVPWMFEPPPPSTGNDYDNMVSAMAWARGIKWRPGHRPTDSDPFSMLSDVLRKADAKRTTYDRVGTWVITFFGVVSIIGMLIPFVWATHKALTVTWPLWRPLHRAGIVEVLLYSLALVVSIYSCRFQAPELPTEGTPWWARMLGGIAGFLISPCWLYSMMLHEPGEGDFEKKLGTAILIGGGLQAASFVALALALSHQTLGFFAVVAVFVCASSACASLRDTGLYFFDLLRCCAEASACVILAAVSLRLRGGPEVGLFAHGAAIFGHLLFLTLMVSLSMKAWPGRSGSYIYREAMAVASLALAMLSGWLLEAPGLTGSGTTLGLFWLLAKDFELHKDKTIRNVAMKTVGVVFVLRYIYMHLDMVFSVADPQNIYI